MRCCSSIRWCSSCRCPTRYGACFPDTPSTSPCSSGSRRRGGLTRAAHDLDRARGDRIRLARAAAAARVPARRAVARARARRPVAGGDGGLSPAPRGCSDCCRSAPAATRSSTCATTRRYGTATGTFVNRNHFAAMLAMMLPVIVGLLVFGLRPGGTSSGGRHRMSPRGHGVAARAGVRVGGADPAVSPLHALARRHRDGARRACVLVDRAGAGACGPEAREPDRRTRWS